MSGALARRFFLAATAIAKTTAVTPATVASMRLKIVFESVGASRHTTGSRNLPIGSQPALNANSQIIIRPNQGVNTVYSETPPRVEVYSTHPPRRQAMILPSANPR